MLAKLFGLGRVLQDEPVEGKKDDERPLDASIESIEESTAKLRTSTTTLKRVNGSISDEIAAELAALDRAAEGG